MTNDISQSNSAYSAVLAHASYASLDINTKIEDKIKSLLTGLLLLCDEYGVEYNDDHRSQKPVLDNPNAGAILDMTFSQLAGVDEDYEDPKTVIEIQWVVRNCSFTCVDNGFSGVYDFIFNLNMLDEYLKESSGPEHVVKQLIAIKEQGYSYILFNQGC